MRQVDEELIRQLTSIESAARSLDPSDSQSIINIGAALEELLPDLPEQPDCLPELVGRCLEGLQSIYERSVSDIPSLCSAVAGGLGAILEFLKTQGAAGSEEAVPKARKRLFLALGHSSPESPKVETDDQPDEPRTSSLDDVVALLMQLGPTDTADLIRVEQDLKAIIARTPFPSEARESMAQALLRVEQLLSGKAPDPDEALSQMGKLLGSAMDSIEEWKLETHSATSAEQQLPDQASKRAAAEAPCFDAPAADADPQLIEEFITECREYIEGAENALLSLEVQPEDVEAVNNVFRTFHTIKGTAGFLGLTQLSELAHHAESLLSRVRDHEILCTGACADLAFRSVDMLKELLSRLQNMLAGQPMEQPEAYQELMGLLVNPEAAGLVFDALASPDEEGTQKEAFSAEGTAAEGKAPHSVEGEDKSSDDSLSGRDSAFLSYTVKAVRADRVSGHDPAAESIRVRTDRLDRLIDLVGELAIAQSMVAQDIATMMPYQSDLNKKVLQVGKIVRDLQYLSMSTRMLPLQATFQKMARLARDIAHRGGKLIQFVTVGEETEIDRNMVDIISDPLMHMVRNAVDHGIEPPEERQNKGKPKRGMVRLCAYHSGGNVVVEVYDDGKGLDRKKIVAKAITRGLIRSEEDVPSNEVFNLIFEPGFTTAESVTDVSGRGVGLDVVRMGVEALRGRIDVMSEAGRGATFTVRLPLTLAVADGTLVKIGSERFLVPTLDIHMSFQPRREALSTVAGRGEFVMLRDELLPIIRLHRLFGIADAIEDPTEGLLVVVIDGDRHYALLVDQLLGQQHSVVKSLGEGAERVQGISGGVILGDGRVGLILDVPETVSLARRSQIMDSRIVQAV